MSTVPDEAFYNRLPAVGALRSKEAGAVPPEHMRACIMELARVCFTLENRQKRLTFSNLKPVMDKAFEDFKTKHNNLDGMKLALVSTFIEEFLEQYDGNTPKE